MQTFPTLKAAQDEEERRGQNFVEIREISPTEWHAYETQEEVPPEPKT